MKAVHLYLSCLLLCTLIVGCKKGNQLQFEKGQATLLYEGQATSLAVAGGLRMCVQSGKPVLLPMKTEGLLGEIAYPQYEKAQVVDASTLDLRIDQGVLSLKGGDRVYVDTVGIGLLLTMGKDAKLEIRVPIRGQYPSRAYAIDTAGRFVGREDGVRRIEFLRELKSQYYMALTRIEYIIGDDQRRYIPNDTGTDVVILDGFSVVGSCDAPPPADCCSGSESVSPEMDFSGWVSDYQAEGRKLLVCFPIGSICTFTDGDKLIVLVCQTGQRYCLDVSICPVTVTTTEGQGICFSVPLDCNLENPFS